MKKNKGYTLIEMIIVITIMAILAGLSAVSLSLISKAKAQDAVTTFNSQLNSVMLKTKAIGTTQKNMYAVFKESTDNNYVLELYDKDASGTVKQKDSVLLKKWSKYVTITYTSEGTNQIESGYGTSSTGFYIMFDKSTGAVLKGAGSYTFKDKKGDTVATVYLDPTTGNHYIK